MCGRYTFSSDSSSEMIQKVLERLEAQNMKVKTGEVNPGDVAAVIACNRKRNPYVFGMKWGYILSACGSGCEYQAAFSSRISR